MSDADAATRERLREGNVAYEQRFDRVFLVRAAGPDARARCSPSSSAGSATTPRPSSARSLEQLAQITRLRVEGLLRA